MAPRAFTIILATTAAVLGASTTAFAQTDAPANNAPAAVLAQSAAPTPGSVLPTVPIPSAASNPGAELVSTAEEDIPVMMRPRPEYDAIGIPLGSFLLFPQLGVNGSYDTNVLRTPTKEVSDYFFTIAPSFRLKSQWNRHMLEIYGGMSDYQYTKVTQEDLADWDVGADGRYDISGRSSLYGNAQVSELHELLSSPNTVGNQKSPNRYYDDHAEIDATVQPSLLGFTAGGIFDRYDYLNTPIVGGGLINNTDRDFDDYQGYVKSFYNFSPGYSGFLRATYESRDFDQFLDRTGLHRASVGYRADGGMDLQVTHLISGEIYLGYLRYDFTAPLKDVSGLDYGVQLDWLATPLITVHVYGGRSLSQIILAGASIQNNDSIGASADYELRRNVIIQAHATYVESSYPGITRQDTYPDLGIGVKYMMNRHLSLNASYDYTDRTSNITGSDFRDSLVTVGINLQQ